LRTIEDLDVKLGSTTMVIEHQDPSLVQIVVFSKARLAALEEYITLAVVIYFYLVRRSVAGHLSQNSFAELPALHKFSKFQRETLLFMALGTSKSKKKQNKLPAYGYDRGGCVKLTSRSLAAPAVAAEILGLFLLPNGRPCRCLTELTMKHQQPKPWDCFFASSRAATTVLLHHCGIVQIDNPNIGHGD
jgi:hypothetical protein